jgi:hypothetical protein
MFRSASISASEMSLSSPNRTHFPDNKYATEVFELLLLSFGDIRHSLPCSRTSVAMLFQHALLYGMRNMKPAELFSRVLNRTSEIVSASPHGAQAVRASMDDWACRLSTSGVRPPRFRSRQYKLQRSEWKVSKLESKVWGHVVDRHSRAGT